MRKEDKNCIDALKNVKFIDGEVMLTFTIDDYYYYKGINEFRAEDFKNALEMFNNIKEENFSINNYSQYIDPHIAIINLTSMKMHIFV